MAWFDFDLTFTHFYLVTSNFALRKDGHHDLSENVKMIEDDMDKNGLLWEENDYVKMNICVQINGLKMQ